VFAIFRLAHLFCEGFTRGEYGDECCVALHILRPDAKLGITVFINGTRTMNGFKEEKCVVFFGTIPFLGTKSPNLLALFHLCFSKFVIP